MNNRRSCSRLEINDMAEGTQKITNSVALTNWWESSSIVHSDLTVEEHNAEEGPQLCIEPESRDDTDSQDAARTTVEAKPYPSTQTIQDGSSNCTPARCVALDLGNTEAHKHLLLHIGEVMK